MDLNIVYFFNQLGRGTFIEPLTEISSSVPFLVAFIILFLALPFIFNKKKGIKVFGAVIIAFLVQLLILEFLLKEFIPFRERPYIAFPEEITAVGRKLSNSSLPSSHMSVSLVFLTVYFYYYKRYWPVFVVMALSMGFIRMHMGMHYPSDVLIGAGLGIVFGALGVFVIERVEKKKMVLYNSKVKKKVGG